VPTPCLSTYAARYIVAIVGSRQRRARLPVVSLGGTNEVAGKPNYADFIDTSEGSHSLP